MARLSKAQKLAVILHEKMCRSNHTDGCSWYYYSEENRWKPENLVEGSYAPQKEYLDKAEKMLAAYDGDFKACVKAVEVLYGPVEKK